jgi:hypothetical protein
MEYNILNIISVVVFLFLIIGFVILSLILNYHWNRYEISIYKTALIKKVYFIVSSILLLVILLLFLNLKK